VAVRKGIKIHGLDIVLKNLNARITTIDAGARAGLKEAALEIQGAAQEMTPHDTGNLKGSADTSHVRKNEKGTLTVDVYYTADYALHVHEIDKNYRVGQWKYLETALKNLSKSVLRILRGAIIRRAMR
jgi:hypothetical protein